MVVTSLSLAKAQVAARKMTIAAVFDEGGDRKHELAFRHAVRAINRNRWGERGPSEEYDDDNGEQMRYK